MVLHVHLLSIFTRYGEIRVVPLLRPGETIVDTLQILSVREVGVYIIGVLKFMVKNFTQRLTTRQTMGQGSRQMRVEQMNISDTKAMSIGAIE